MRLACLLALAFAQKGLYWDSLFVPQERTVIYGSAPKRLRLQAQSLRDWLLERERPPIAWPIQLAVEVPPRLLMPFGAGLILHLGYYVGGKFLALFQGSFWDSLCCACLTQAAYFRLKGFYLEARLRHFWQKLRGSSTPPLYALGLTAEVPGCLAPLKASLFLPTPRLCDKRPVVVFLHSGGYFMGSYKSADMRHLAHYFAARGYVTASVEYRLGLPHFSEGGLLATSLQAMHDLKAFIRYLKKSVVEEGNPFGIDTSRIYVGGSSAGAITALHAAYLTEQRYLEEYAPYLSPAWVALEGGIEGLSGNPGYSSTFHGVFSISGAMLKADWIDPSKVSAVLVFHGTEDPVIPFRLGTWPTPPLKWDGGFIVDSVAAAKGLYHALATWEGPLHAPFWKSVEEVDLHYLEPVKTFLRTHFYRWNQVLGEQCQEATL